MIRLGVHIYGHLIQDQEDRTELINANMEEDFP